MDCSEMTDTARLDDALDRANQCRQAAIDRRHFASLARKGGMWEGAYLASADAHDAEADAIMSEMKDEGHG